MRSELVFQALKQVPNRFRLCQLTSKASRSFFRNAVVSSAQPINEPFEAVARKQPTAELPADARAVTDLAA